MTRGEYLKRLPEDIRMEVEEAILLHGVRDLYQTLQEEIEHLPSILGAPFIWYDTKQGSEYWSNINNTYFNK